MVELHKGKLEVASVLVQLGIVVLTVRYRTLVQHQTSHALMVGLLVEQLELANAFALLVTPVRLVIFSLIVLLLPICYPAKTEVLQLEKPVLVFVAACSDLLE